MIRNKVINCLMYMASEWCNRHCWYCFRWEAAIDDFVQLLADEHFSACQAIT